jgi:hypothetical protein
MVSSDSIEWFKLAFGRRIEQALRPTTLSLDMLVALACQETGRIWGVLHGRHLTEGEILELCVGDTLDDHSAWPRKSFPRTREELESVARGKEMYVVARASLLNIARHIPAYALALKGEGKMCHGFGLFLRDLADFPADPDFFLCKRWATLEGSVQACIDALSRAARQLGIQLEGPLTDEQRAALAIMYDCGRYDPARGLRQGHFDGMRYYGESFMLHLQASRSIQVRPAMPFMSRAGSGMLAVAGH